MERVASWSLAPPLLFARAVFLTCWSWRCAIEVSWRIKLESLLGPFRVLAREGAQGAQWRFSPQAAASGGHSGRARMIGIEHADRRQKAAQCGMATITYFDLEGAAPRVTCVPFRDGEAVELDDATHAELIDRRRRIPGSASIEMTLTTEEPGPRPWRRPPSSCDGPSPTGPSRRRPSWPTPTPRASPPPPCVVPRRSSVSRPSSGAWTEVGPGRSC